ncbi:insulin-like growth factor-binding protein complex acid labile subunit [Anabrus simplex]|uniref:insulin-like growth factor-binding protein complex acid labile subunit n=1 Tax=Anabrus simplex TaxID=316456 RepID=UPI0035A32528
MGLNQKDLRQGQMMKMLVYLLMATVLITGPSLAATICPQLCSCGLDIKGRHQVICSQGGMFDPIPITSMDQQVEVLIITAPESNPNFLTIGPIFQQFTRLEELHITDSNIPAIGKHSFWGVPTMQELNLVRNNISHVLDYNFRGLVNLLKLHLDDNRIESMPSGTFRYLQELRVLTLARNRITELVPRLFLMLGKLHELDLSGNKLVDLNPEVFKDVQELRVLRCRGCSLSNINTMIYRLLPDLIHLDLGDNEFKYVASDEFRDLRKLQVLKLDGNQLPVVLERSFGGQLELQKLSLARNRLAKVTTTAFANLTTLRDLDLSYNKLDHLETTTFLPLNESLRRLELSGNTVPLTEVKYVLQVVLKLREISLADMGLSELPLGFLVYHEHLRFLNLSGNSFFHFPVQILSPVPKLQELDLSRNKFRGLDEGLLSRFESIKTVHLHGNPWACDLCHITPILTHINKGYSSMFRGLRCVSPYSLEGRLLETLHRSSLGWCSKSEGGFGYVDGATSGDSTVTTDYFMDDSRLGLIAAGAAVLLLLLTGVALFAGIAHSRHHAAHYYTREEQRGPEHESIFENPTAMLTENGDITYKTVPADVTQAKKKKKVSISTIDGIKKDPELHTLTNGT